MPLPEDINRHVTGDFSHGAVGSIVSAPLNCITFCCCPACSLFSQRRRIQRITKEPYVCCGGLWPCCGFEKPLPDEFMCVEACFMPNAALAGNRFLMQTRMNKKNTAVDKFFSIFHCCVACECKIARICFECSEERENLVKSMICVCPVSHCQVGAELKDIEHGGSQYAGVSSGLINQLPVHFSNIGIKAANAPQQMKMVV